jgi:Flp pilus assembly protein TadG
VTKRKKDRTAAAAVELAVLLPFLMFLAVIATDWARILYFTITLDNCARNGALYLCDDEARARSPYASYEAAAKAEASELTQTLTVTKQDIAAADSGDGSPAARVTVSMNFKTLTNFNYPSWFGVTQNNAISRTVQMRVLPKTPS